MVARLRQQVVHGRAKQHGKIAGFTHGLTGDRGDARYQRSAAHNRVGNGDHAADILADNTDIQRQSATGHLLAGQQLNQLFLAAGGVFGGE